jgi:hypothetical protein
VYGHIPLGAGFKKQGSCDQIPSLYPRQDARQTRQVVPPATDLGLFFVIGCTATNLTRDHGVGPGYGRRRSASRTWYAVPGTGPAGTVGDPNHLVLGPAPIAPAVPRYLVELRIKLRGKIDTVLPLQYK